MNDSAEDLAGRLTPIALADEVERLRARVAELEDCAGLEDCAQQHAVDRARIAELKARLALAQQVIDLTDAFVLDGDASAIEPLRAVRAEWDRGEM